VKKFLQKKLEKKEILRNPGRNGFWGSKKRIPENRNRQPSVWLYPSMKHIQGFT
jgi:hypothetical protein